MSFKDKNQSSGEMTLKDLTPNTAGLLCYVAGWISGVIFLILEQKNRFVRFHALQSIIVFGILALIVAVFGNLPVVGPAFGWIIGITGFIFWIILMVKAVNGEVFKMPWAGNLAERLTNESMGLHTQPDMTKSRLDEKTPPVEPAEPAPAASPVTERSKSDEFRSNYYSAGARSGRITGSAFTIAWSAALLIFLNFYNQYIAYYEPFQSESITRWQAHTLITAEFNAWLPIATASLVLAIIGHAFLIAFDKYVLRETVQIFLDAFAAVVFITLLYLFPFDFSPLPSLELVRGVTIGVTISLILIAVGFGIGALVRLILLVANVAKGRY